MDRSKLPKEVQDQIGDLNKAIFRQDADQAAQIYQTILRHDADFVLREPVQFDLARLLEAGRQDELALAAFQLLIKHQPTHMSLAAALKSAGVIAFKLKRHELCMDHFERLIEIGPTNADRLEIDDMMSRMPPDTRRRANKLVSSDHIAVPNFTPLPIVDSKIELPGLHLKTPTPAEKGREEGANNISMEWRVQKTPTPPSRNHHQRASVEANTLPPPMDIWAEAKPLSELESEQRDRKKKSGPISQPSERLILGTDLPPTPPIRTSPVPPPPPQYPPQQVPPPSGYPPPQQAYPPGYYPPYVPPPGYYAPPGYMITPMPGPFPTPPPGYYPPPQPMPPAIPQGQPYPPPPEMAQAVPPPAAPQVQPPSPSMPKLPSRAPKALPVSKADNKKFPPANAKAVSKRYSPPENETPEARYHRLRDAQFALILPLNKRIHLESVADFVAKHEQVEPSVANKKVLRKKGLLYDELTLQEVLELAPLVKECKQSLVFVSVPRQLRPYEHFEVTGAESRDQGLKLHIGSTTKRIRWDDIQLINCGRIGNDSFATILGSEPMKEYRFGVKSFDFSSILPTRTEDELPELYEFIEMLSKHAPDSVLSHTAQTVLKEKSPVPQPFGSAEEFHSYALWMLFSHRAEIIDAAELQQLSHITSNW
ncbi:tetratricopeptide repeat protein [Candidatus Sumerlaeota bacterium]|nr:tetratricopeptide repeat protein [Candidatus Sumerlaeota bacterium]